MTNIVYRLRRSDHVVARLLRQQYQWLGRLSLPAPRIFVKPIVVAALLIVAVMHWVKRVVLCEPYLKARCFKHGANIQTGKFFHYITGPGHIILGDGVQMIGKSSIMFASILPKVPELLIGDDSFINHNATLVVADRITVGRKVLIGPGVTIFDSPGHPLDPARRIAGEPPAPDEIRPVTIEDHVWICTGATIFPGVTIGEGSVVALGAVVTKSVAPRTLVAGSPARVIRQL